MLALGGASWPKLGFDARWAAMILAEQKVTVIAAAAGQLRTLPLPWSDVLRGFAGQPLKRISLSFAGRSARGEAMMTQSKVWKAARSMRCHRHCATPSPSTAQ